MTLLEGSSQDLYLVRATHIFTPWKGHYDIFSRDLHEALFPTNRQMPAFD